ncbi:hypothetical protein CerSpe_268200 [Prunus speciosa]
MNCFILPKSFCDELNSLIAKFWWSGDRSKRKIHWLCWQNLCKAKKEGGLDFRDLRALNFALLAKQGWHFIQHPNLLVARLFQGKYYVNSSFWDAPEGKHSSFCWRSIFAAKQVLVRGTKWQVGDGSSIRVWSDKWLSSPCTISLSSLSPSVLEREMKVFALIDPWGQWNESFIQSLFPLPVVKEICSVPLSFRKPPNRIVWHHDPNGIFSVKSVYEVARLWLQNENTVSAPVPAGDEATKIVWSAIWKANIPPKVKICAWKIAWNIIPTRVNLVRKKVDCVTDCLRCIAGEDSALHIFVVCPYATAVWTASLVGSRVLGVSASNMLGWLKSIFETLLAYSSSLVLMTLWALWKDRNSRLWEGIGMSPFCLVALAQSWLSKFHHINNVSRRPHATLNTLPRWTSPPDGFSKVNVDGFWRAEDGRGGFGLVIRNELGLVLASGAWKLEYFGCSDQTHLVALQSGMKLAADLGITHANFESNSKKTVLAVTKTCSHDSPLGVLFADCGALLSHFLSATVAYVPKTCNRVACRLSHFSLSVSQDCLWLVEPPDLLQDLLYEDCNSSFSL